MNRRTFVGLIFLVTIGACSQRRALAQVIDEVGEPRHYQFIPSSTLTETGGFVGVHINYAVRGRFDFSVEDGGTDVWPPRDVSHFANVDAWASHPILAYVKPLDQAINLSGLTGHEILTPGPLKVFRYEGTTGDGSSVQGVTATLGRWMYLRFGTKAPADSADFFEYRLRGLARERRFADFNANDAVEGGDLAALVPKFAANLPAAVDSPAWGDANGDRLVDGSDLLMWQQQLGEAPPDFARFESMVDAALAAATSTSLAAAPEPNAIVCAATALASLVAGRRSRSAPR